MKIEYNDNEVEMVEIELIKLNKADFDRIFIQITDMVTLNVYI